MYACGTGGGPSMLAWVGGWVKAGVDVKCKKGWWCGHDGIILGGGPRKRRKQ